MYEEKDKSKYKIDYLGEKISKDLYTHKIILIGRYGVGRKSIINRIFNKEFDKEYTPTMTIDINFLQIKVNDKIIQIDFWDSCGNEKFTRCIPNLFRNVSLAIIVYAINDKKSYEDVQDWYNIIKEYSFDSIIFLIGNKNDLEKEREVTIEEGEQFKNNYDDIKMFFETSAIKNDNNLDKLLENIAITIYEKDKDFQNKEDNPITKTISLFKWTLQ